MFSGHWEILLIVALIFLLFGAKRVPGMMENLAKGIKSFKRGLKEDDQIEEQRNGEIEKPSSKETEDLK